MDRLVTTFPTMFGHYRLLRRLGTGGMGEVYLAEDTAFRNRKTAVKIPLKRPMRSQRHGSSAKRMRSGNCGIRTFANSTTRARSMVRRTWPWSTSKARTRGADRQGRRWPAEEAVSIIVKLASALQHAHESGVIHRDIKPSNVMFWASGEPVLMDFGLAKLTGDPTVTQANGMFGTPAYMPLEQARGDLKNIGPHSDVFSLGVVLFEMLSGQRAMNGESTMEVLFKLLNEPSPHLKFVVPDLDPQLADVCAKAMAKKWQERYRSMSEFSTALSACKVAVPEPVFQHSLEDVLVEESNFELHPSRPGDTSTPGQGIPTVQGVVAAGADETQSNDAMTDSSSERKSWFKANAIVGLVCLLGLIVFLVLNQNVRDEPKSVMAPPSAVPSKPGTDGKQLDQPGESKPTTPKSTETPNVAPPTPATQVAEPEPKPGEERSLDLGGGVTLVMCYIPKGECQLGSPNAERDTVYALLKGEMEHPEWLKSEAEEVRGKFKTNGFWLAKYECTQEQYERIMGKNPSYYDGTTDATGKGQTTSKFPVEGFRGTMLKTSSGSSTTWPVGKRCLAHPTSLCCRTRINGSMRIVVGVGISRRFIGAIR